MERESRAPQTPLSVLTILQEKTGEAPHIALREEDSGLGGASPMIDPLSAEKLALPQGKGNYQLMGEIARGGMGVVLKGHDTDLGRDVALKVLHKDLAGRPDILQRFVEEAQIGGQLQHPGIVPVYELGLMADERPYFTMKLVKGRTLATLLAERESVVDGRRKLLDVFLAVCQTLAYAHSRGVIHRDLKPDNIMVGAFGEVQVVDWGLAKVLARGGAADEKQARRAPVEHTVLETVRSPGSSSGSGVPGSGSSSTDSVVGSVMGTPAYMPPEQAAGMVDKLDERSDVFSLGAILCEVLTGKPPYAGESHETLIQAAQAELDDALARLDECEANEELLKLTKQCLMPALLTRPRNAGVVAERIHGHLESVEERARQLQIQAAEMQVRTEEALVHARNERRARNLVLALAAAVVGMLAVGGGGWMWAQNERAARREQLANAELERTRRERDIDAGVGASLSQADLLAGQRNWTEAEAALVQARVLAATGEASAVRAADIEAAGGRLAKAREVARFAADLDSIRQGGMKFADYKTLDEGYAQRFAGLGLDVDSTTPEAFERSLAERGIGTEIVPALDHWIIVLRLYERNETRGGEAPEVLTRITKLVDITNVLDDDPLRADLREAQLTNDVERLRLLAQDGLEDQPTSTLALLGASLNFAGERDAGLDVLRFGVRRHPGDFALRAALSQQLNGDGLQPGWVRDECLEALEQERVAVALRPDDPDPRFAIVWIGLGLAWDELRAGDEAEATRWYREAWLALESVPELPFPPYHLARGWVLEGVGEPERARDSFRSLLDAPPMDASYGQSAAEWQHWFRVRAGEALLRLGALEDAELAFEPILSVDTGPALGSWAVSRALQHVRSGDVDAALLALSSAVESSALDRGSAANWVSWRMGRYPRDAWLTILGASTEAEREHLEPGLEALMDLALELAESSLNDTAPASLWNAAGLLRYRCGDAGGALEALEEATRVRGVGNAYDEFFMALALFELGEVERGRSVLARAEEHLQVYSIATVESGSLHELLGFRREAEARFGDG